MVLEPEDATGRTGNLQQTNTNGYRIQTEKSDLLEAQRIVDSWGEEHLKYSPKPGYQELIRSLLSKFTYRLDTNYAKIDRIEHIGIEKFKERVDGELFNGKTINEWRRILTSSDDKLLSAELKPLLRYK